VTFGFFGSLIRHQANGKLMIEPVRLDSSDRHEKVKLPVFCRAFFLACGLRRG